MPAVWDTSLLSRVQPNTELLDRVLDQAAEGRAIRVASPAILEVSYGYALKAAGDPRFRRLLEWFTELVASDDLRVIAFDGRAGLIAGRVRGAIPYPPGGKKGDKQSKTMRQAAWLLDIQIAATAFAAGLDVATANRGDFDAISNVLAALFPEADRLEVSPAPF
jgi:predicted nucleic acid-binding protein